MTESAPPALAIYALTIERFRGITTLRWKPSRGVNVILGGGDVGKTTILKPALCRAGLMPAEERRDRAHDT